ncbi:hypothetical protein [Desulforamulus aquiferis]|uniref:Double zinc ribbon domain-containing protein n=1 Tax=Desulforamulus aquiferis TaxID=1397668 RepID=A0AAW7Z9J7_9FIRM|nr:hypothetical protein [Desulforamulus aquiferis]MDO7786319.1 hypothetical protein [Desulforamulus aquiferis]
MSHFPNIRDQLFHVPSQQVGTALGGCLTSNLVTVRFKKGPVLSIRLAELVPNKNQPCPHCGRQLKPDRDGVCKDCYTVLCPICQECKCTEAKMI